MILEFDPEKATTEDIIYLFFNSLGEHISEDFYEYVDINKVKRAAIKQDYSFLIKEKDGKMEIYEDLAYKYSTTLSIVRRAID